MARRLADGLWQFDLGLFRPLASNVFLVDGAEVSGGDDAVTLVDTGLPINLPTVRGELDDAGFVVADIDRVLLTHYDLDHVGGLARLAGLDADVYMGAADVDLVRGHWHPEWTHHKGAFHRLARMLYSMDDYDLHAVEDGDTIGGFTAFHTPGHNPGHTVYHHEGFDAAFLGDLVWEEDGELTIPIWLDSYDMAEIRESVRSFADRAPPFERGLMCHGNPVLEGADALMRALADRLVPA
ncbi:MBL fold metallo-hydrolase [Halorarius litoreus]|uniref:MBL fold metallo-hydrolase n=1 Tax=Halorarius litoreus TaxID=2962676 RepID=UPI0020CC7E10|nr:MBL fold metallo-hydrolase [Halorarius litoreus]